MNESKAASRRRLLLSAGGGIASWGAALGRGSADGVSKMKTVAAVITEYGPRSHADVICGRIMGGYRPNGIETKPRTRIISMYTDQVAKQDMSRTLSQQHGFSIYPTISEALTLGQDKLAVDAVLLVGEHGIYPDNDKGQKLYPRYELFQQVVEVFKRSGRVVPLFSDKHLSYSWAKGKAMYDQARALSIPFMAGSSIPLLPREPALELPMNCAIDGAVVVGYGPIESYGFHSLDSLQSMVERRQGGETGIAAVEAIKGDNVWKWRDSDAGRWSAPLLDAALGRATNMRPGKPEDNARRPVLFVLQYRDGLKAAVYMLERQQANWTFAARLKGQKQPVSTSFGKANARDLPNFDGLVRCIEEFFVTGLPTHPVERTLLIGGALDFLMASLKDGKRIETPELKIAYQAPKRSFVQTA